MDKQRIARELWSHCFQDPDLYEDFYFETIYPRNRVYFDGEKGMLHLNPYLCHVNGSRIILHYIVGVGTKSSCRRQGVMAGLMKQALQDMWKSKEPFTYLMPADVRYYEPFDFVSVSKEQECLLTGNTAKEWNNKMISYYTYEMLFRDLSKEKVLQIFEKMDAQAAKEHTISAVRDEEYFNLLFKEKVCQGGDVVFCFDEMHNVIGFFAYAMDENTLCVEQTVWIISDTFMKAVSGFYSGPIRWMQTFPYMIRITNASAFMQLFGDACKRLAGDKAGLYIQDDILPGNTGYYSERDGWKRIETGTGCTKEEYCELTIEELTDKVLGTENIFNYSTFWAEVV